jgi:hypothetical protein
LTVRIIQRSYPAAEVVAPAVPVSPTVPTVPGVPVEHATFIGLSPEAWTAIGTLSLAVATLALIAVGVWQIRSVRDEAKRSRTLMACERYDLDPVLDRSCRRLVQAKDSGDLEKYPRVFRADIWSILNYLESLAIGIERDLYLEPIVKDYMSDILAGYIEEYITGGLAQRAAEGDIVGQVERDYAGIIKLNRKWSANAKAKDLTLARSPS